MKYGSEVKQGAFFCTLGGNNVGKTFDEMEARLGKKPVATAQFKANNIKDDRYLTELDAFVEKLV